MHSKLTLLACLALAACASTEPKPEPTRYAMSCGEALNAQLDCLENSAQCNASGRIN